MLTRAQLCTLLGLILAAAPVMYAQTTYTWTGAGLNGNVSTAANWLGGVAPTGLSTDILVFGNSPQQNVNFNNSLTVGNIAFTGTAMSYYLNGNDSYVLTLAGGVTTSPAYSYYGVFNGSLPLVLTSGSHPFNVEGSAIYLWGNISGSGSIVMSSTDSLTLGSDNTFGGGLTVASGTLYLSRSSTSEGSTIISGPVGTGTLTLQGGTTLSPAYYSGDVTLANNLSLGDKVTFGSGYSFASNSGESLTLTGIVTTTLNNIATHLAPDLTLFIKGTLDGPVGTSITFDNGTANRGGAVVLAGTTTNHITSLTANSAGIVFAAPTAIPAPGGTIQALNGGYVSVGILDPAYIPSAVTVLSRITDKANFNGTFGFDTDPALTAPPPFSEALVFSGFVNPDFRIGSASTAVLASSATITPPGNNYRFGGGNGLLRVESNLSDNVATPRTLTVSSPNGDSLTLWLAGTNTFTGGITLDNSLLRIANANALPTTGNIIIPSASLGYLGFDYDLAPTALAAVGARIASESGTLVLGFDSTSPASPRLIESSINLATAEFPASTVLGTSTNLTLSSTITITPAGDVTAPWRFAAVKHGSLTVASLLDGTRGVEIGLPFTGGNGGYDSNNFGPNNVTLTGANTYSGGTTLFDGVLHLTTSSTSLAGVIQFGPLGTGPVTIDASATNVSLQPDPSGAPTPITITLDNPIAVNTIVSVGDDGNGNTLVLNGPVSGPAGLTVIGNLTLNNAASTYGSTYGGIYGGTQLQTGTLTFGASSVTSLGTIISGPLGIGQLTVSSGSGSPALRAGGPGLVLANPIEIDVQNVLIGGANAFTLAGPISSWGGIQKDGTFTLTLGGNNTFTGQMHINEGSVAFTTDTAAGGGALAFGLPTSGNPSATFTSAAPTIYGLQSETANVSVNLAADSKLTINQYSDATYSGTITGTGASLVKIGSAKLALYGNSNYTGGTTITQGQLVAGSNHALGTNTVTINGGSLGIANDVALPNTISFGASGGTLGGSGTIGSNITVGSNVALAPGDSPGTLTFTGNLTWASGGSYNLEIVSAAGNVPGTSYDTIVIASTGSLTITANSGGKFNLDLLSLSSTSTAGNIVDFNPGNSYSWQIASSTNAISGFSAGAFNIDTTGFTNPLNGGFFNVSPGGPGGNTALFLNFTPVPEPSTWALLIVGTGAVLFPALRRRRS